MQDETNSEDLNIIKQFLKVYGSNITNRFKKIYTKCPICDFYCIPTSEFAKHIKKHLRIYPLFPGHSLFFEILSCAKCSFKTTVKNDMATHIKNHYRNFRNESKPDFGRNSEQDSDTSSESNSKIYLNCQNKEEKFFCNMCHLGYLNKSSLTYHLEKKHHITDGRLRFKCKRCDFSAKLKSSLKKHMKIHSKTYNCKLCKFFAYNPVILREHKQLEH